MGTINMFIYFQSQPILYRLRIIHIILKPMHMAVLGRKNMMILEL